MTKDEALDLVLDWLVCYKDKSMSRNNAEELAEELITAIKQARSAPVQEPAIKQGWDVDTLLDKPAAQRQWTGLTDEDISAAYEQMPDYEMYDEFARAIEAKLRSKNNG
jgi:Tfp pilus assembly protein FimT